MKLVATAAALFALSLAACSTQKVAVKPTGPTAEEMARFIARSQAIDEMMRNFQRVQFEFDSALITQESRSALADNAEIMMRFDELQVEVEGHCDEQGAAEYNLALGDRRAQAIRKYLVTAGVGSRRVRTISYGEELPFAIGDDDASLEMNRRAEFRINVDPSARVHGTVQDVAAADPSTPVDTLAAY